MNTIKKLTIGGSTIEDFAKNTFIKNNLSNKLKETIKNLKAEFLNFNESSSFTIKELVENNELVINDTNSKTIQDLLNLVDAALLHGLKEKLNFSKVLSPLKINPNSNRFSNALIKNFVFHDFWPVILILSHNQLSSSLKNMKNIQTDIGRCRAWVRLALNDSLLCSYLKVLINDISLLHGFYRPSAYLRDKEHMENFISLFSVLEHFTFDLNYDYYSLNFWDENSVLLAGYSETLKNLQENDEDILQPVLPAIDALKMLEKIEETNLNDENIKEDYKEFNLEKQDVEVLSDEEQDKLNQNSEIIENLPIAGNSIQVKTGWSTSPQQSLQFKIKNDLGNTLVEEKNYSIQTKSLKSVDNSQINNKEVSQHRKSFDDCSYDSLLASYSSEAILCSTPETKKTCIPNSEKQNETIIKKRNFYLPHSFQKSEFLSKFFQIQPELGLDEQDYKCHTCGRPIGMVYGKSRLCRYDGFIYCLECNKDDKTFVPAKIIHNWDFNKYTVSKENKAKLDLLENEPLIDLKVVNSLLYKYNDVMKECLELRTQLFYLHAYLFTCQESIALDLRKQVWPCEHLFEHIHLYSLNDLVQVQSGLLSSKLKKSIQLAKKHVISCILCSQKGFICEICRSSKIIYPFDIDKTYTCDNCKTVFHLSCIIISNSINSNKQLYNSIIKPKHRPCPRCIRIKCREKVNQDKTS